MNFAIFNYGILCGLVCIGLRFRVYYVRFLTLNERITSGIGIGVEMCESDVNYGCVYGSILMKSNE